MASANVDMNAPIDALLRDRRVILHYFDEPHSDWGFVRAEDALALIDAALILKGYPI